MDLLNLKEVKKYFPIGRKKTLRAVESVSFGIKKGEVFGLVGESGCGKSTLARLILRLIEPTMGDINFMGIDIPKASRGELKKVRKNLQIIFQDPLASLNPRQRIIDAVGEGLIINKIVPKHMVRDRVVELLEKVGLSSDALNKYPHEFSGGQRQRICIARALAVNPLLIVADEPLSALDVSVQAQIMNLLINLQRERGLSYLFISHNLLAVQYICNTVAVMYLGRIVEMAPTDHLFSRPMHPYTEALLSALPRPEVSERRQRIILRGDVPSPVAIPSGCPFHPRCHRKMDTCTTINPELKKLSDGRWVSCHLWN